MPFKEFWSYILSLSKGKPNETHINGESLEPLLRRNEWEEVDTYVFTAQSKSEELEKKQLRPQEAHSGGLKLGYSREPGEYSELEPSEDSDEDSDEYSGLEGSYSNQLGLGKSDTAHDIDKIKENGVFILCIHCIRMVYIVVASYSSFARLLSPESGLSFAAGICRTCANFEAVTEETYSVPYKILENTRMYLCACIVAREELPIAEEKNVFVDVALNDPGFINSDCQVYEVRTDEHTLSKLDQLDRDKLLLEHVSGGFF